MVEGNLIGPCGLYCGWCPSTLLAQRSPPVKAAGLVKNVKLGITQKVRV